MTLAAWQTAVVELVSGRRVRSDDRLSPNEEAWLHRVADAPGTDLTRTVATTWRIERLGRAAPLTLLLLRRLGCEPRVVRAYVDATLAPSAYLIPEGLQFLAFVERVAPMQPHLAEVLELERRALLARSAPWSEPSPVRRATGWLDRDGRGAAIEVVADPEELLVALVTGRSLPAAGSGAGTLLVGPGVDGAFRVADVAERRVLHEVPGPRPYVEVVTTPAAAHAVERLVRAGVLAHRPNAAAHPSVADWSTGCDAGDRHERSSP